MMLALQNRKIYNWSLAGIQARVVIKQLFSNLCHPKYKEILRETNKQEG